MKTFHNWELSHETYEEQKQAGRYNPAQQITIDNGPKLTISAGDCDLVDVFTEHGLYYVVSVNHGLGYCGLEVFDKDGNQEGETFLQVDYEIAEILGPRGVDLMPINIAKRLADYALV